MKLRIKPAKQEIKETQIVGKKESNEKKGGGKGKPENKVAILDKKKVKGLTEPTSKSPPVKKEQKIKKTSVKELPLKEDGKKRSLFSKIGNISPLSKSARNTIQKSMG